MVSLEIAPSKSPSARLDVRVVRLEEIFFHEPHDPARSADLARTIDRHQIFSHPIIVMAAPSGEGRRYIHVDGANRAAVLRALGCELAVVQVVPPEALEIGVWSHEVPLALDAVDRLRRMDGVEIAVARPALPVARDAAFIWTAKAAVRVSVDGGLDARLRALAELVLAYRGRVTRRTSPLIPSQAQLAALASRRTIGDTATSLVTFVPLTTADFAALARRQLLAPAGVTRFVLPAGRAIGIPVPIDLLRCDAHLKAAQAAVDACLARPPVAIVPPPSSVAEYLGVRVYDDLLVSYDPAIQILPASAD